MAFTRSAVRPRSAPLLSFFAITPMPSLFSKYEEREKRLAEYSRRLVRIEAHMRRNEYRAARRRLNTLLAELDSYVDDLEFPLESTFIGAQLGLLSGNGPLLTGRLPGAVIGAVGGWLFGHATAKSQETYLSELIERAGAIYNKLEESS